MKSQYTAPPILVAVGLSKILKVKQKLGVTMFESKKTHILIAHQKEDIDRTKK